MLLPGQVSPVQSTFCFWGMPLCVGEDALCAGRIRRDGQTVVGSQVISTS